MCLCIQEPATFWNQPTLGIDRVGWLWTCAGKSVPKLVGVDHRVQEKDRQDLLLGLQLPVLLSGLSPTWKDLRTAHSLRLSFLLALPS